MTRWLGVALLPRADHLRSAIRVQQEVAGGHTLQPPLTPEGNLPHTTVFQGPFLDTLEPDVELDRIGGALSLPEEIRLHSTGVVYQPTGWVFLSLERPPLLEKLQDVVVGALAPHLDRDAFDTAKEVSRFTDNERTSYARYGYRYTGEAYTPHITLGRTEEQAAQALVRDAAARSSVPAAWIFDRLSFYVMGEHGAHAQTLVERALKRT
ncbi:2'-5' RNA ligase family protein [Streptomyces sp. NPDC049040]|uniref:2'-5' RNA ligase family protein n=1 Tax=Streptomyces sp. NPDC049040 TaxID=3365593 RepID=UPI003719FF3B